MATDPVADGLQLHADFQFIDSSKMEQYFVTESDDDGHDRLGYYFGPECPLLLWKGHPRNALCKSYKEKLHGCRSYICENFAVNYLAKHGLESSNHDMLRDREAAFAAAEAVAVETFIETENDRKWYRDAVKKSQDKKGNGGGSSSGQRDASGGSQLVPRQPKRPPTERQQERERSPYRQADEGGQDQVDATPITMVANRLASAAANAADLQITTLAKVGKSDKSGVKVRVQELEALHACLQRSETSQQKLVESLMLFSRQFEDERQITKEAKDAVQQLIMKGKVQEACQYAAEGSRPH